MVYTFISTKVEIEFIYLKLWVSSSDIGLKKKKKTFETSHCGEDGEKN